MSAKMKLPFLFLLCFLFLAFISVSVSFASKEIENSISYDQCLQSCPRDQGNHRYRSCQARCIQIAGWGPEEEPPKQIRPQGCEEEEGRPSRAEEQPGGGGRPWPPRPEEQPGGEDWPWPLRPEEQPGGGGRPSRSRPEEQQGGGGKPEQQPGEGGRPSRPRPEEQPGGEEWLWPSIPEEQPGGGGSPTRPEEQPGGEDWPWPSRPEEQPGGGGRPTRPEEQPGEGGMPTRPEEQPGKGGRPTRPEPQPGGERQQPGSGGQQQHPYYFPSHRFQAFYKSEHGYIRALPRFDRFTRLFRGLNNYRLIEFQSRPQTFFLPHHSNAHYLFVILRGKALFTIVNQNSRESYNLERAEVLVVPAGSTVYGANRDNNQNLRVVQLAIPVNNHEQFEFFYPGGLQNPQSYYNGFSRQTLEATFNAQYQEVQRALLGQRGQQQQGPGLIVKASRDQIRQLTQQARPSQEGGQGQSQSGPFNLQNYETPISSNYGKLWEARPNQLPQLGHLGVSLGWTQLKPGALFLPHYNTEKTALLYVVQGNGTIEMACPHLPSQKPEGGSGCQCQEEQEQQPWRVGQIRRLTAQVNEGDAYVIPAGHPVALRASNKAYLHIVSFGINDENNQMNFLAGARNNMIYQIDKVAKELAFSGSAEQVERLLSYQKQSYIVNGQPQLQQPQQQQQQGKRSEGGLRSPLSSILGAFM